MSTTEVVHEIRRACRQTGVTTVERLGLTDRQRQAAINKGLLERWPRGVLLDPSFPNSAEKELAAATAVGRPDAAAWGLLPAGATLEKGEPLFPRKET